MVIFAPRKTYTMKALKEKEYWVYRKSDHSLVGTLDVTELEDEFMDVSFTVCSGVLTHAETDKIERRFEGQYIMERPGREEYFGDFKMHEGVCDAVRNHPDGECYLTTVPILPYIE